jgi:hypothetical protein
MELPPRPDGEDFGSFYPWWKWAGYTLDELLKPTVSFLNRGSVGRSAIGRLLHCALVSYGEAIEDGAMDLQLAIYLAQDLTDLLEKDPAVFEDFRKRLVSPKARKPDWLVGHSFEMQCALLLLKNGFTFTSPDPPDFSIETGVGTVHVECFAPYVSGGATVDVRKRTREAIRKKAKHYRGQDWLQGHTVLFLDATYLRRYEWGEVSSGDVANGLERGMQDALMHTPFGLIVSFWGGHVFKDGQDWRCASCVTAPHPVKNTTLAAFRSQLLKRFEADRNELNLRIARAPN